MSTAQARGRNHYVSQAMGRLVGPLSPTTGFHGACPVRRGFIVGGHFSLISPAILAWAWRTSAVGGATAAAANQGEHVMPQR
jgi:hypothetical protein